GHFYAFGPALSREVVEVVIGDTKTSHARAGTRGAPPTPPRERVRQILAQLADLPAEAEAEAKTAEELRARVRELEAKNRALAANTDSGVNTAKFAELQRMYEASVDDIRMLQKSNYELRAALGSRDEALNAISNAMDLVSGAVPPEVKPKVIIIPKLQEAMARVPKYNLKAHQTLDSGVIPIPDGFKKVLGIQPNGTPVNRPSFAVEISKMERTFLICLAQRKAPLSRKKILTLTGYRNSGNVGFAFAHMLREGWVVTVAGGGLEITRDGTTALGEYDELPTGPELREVLLSDERKLS